MLSQSNSEEIDITDGKEYRKEQQSSEKIEQINQASQNSSAQNSTKLNPADSTPSVERKRAKIFALKETKAYAEKRYKLDKSEDQTNKVKLVDALNSSEDSPIFRPDQEDPAELPSAGSTLPSSRSRSWSQSAITDLLQEQRMVEKSTAAESLVRCTVFDPQGNVQVVNGEFRKSELLSKHGLLPRDLRKIDSGPSTTMPAILVRNNSIVINLLHIRAIVKADMVMIFNVYGSTDSQTQSIFMYDLEGKLRQGSKAMGGLPYEMRALEAILISVVTALDAEMKIHTTIVTGILADLENNIDREKLRHLLVQSKGLAAFLQKATLIRDAINEVLEQDDDLAGMYLTEKLKGNVRPSDEHSEVEMLLESYYKHCDEIVQETNITITNVRTTEEIVNIILDANRNSLMLLELKYSICAIGLGGGALVAALYGMNIPNYLEQSIAGFFLVSLFAGGLCIAIIMVGFRNLRKVQRVTMMWDHPLSSGRHIPVHTIAIGPTVAPSASPTPATSACRKSAAQISAARQAQRSARNSKRWMWKQWNKRWWKSLRNR
ncbi:uncharacterized protein V1516DRAFT_620798 [Lipomyces oligophaga]|uniref:uncharacterized protein n=1 Tax=Lipomyces oligophaga TaxID=45792 RepID=UPI0034CE365F